MRVGGEEGGIGSWWWTAVKNKNGAEKGKCGGSTSSGVQSGRSLPLFGGEGDWGLAREGWATLWVVRPREGFPQCMVQQLCQVASTVRTVEINTDG